MAVVEAVRTEPTGHQGARWSRAAALGLVLVGLAPLMMMVAAVVSGGVDDPADLLFFGVVSALSLGAAFLVRRFGTWSKVVGILVAVLAVGAMFWTAFGLAYPGSFFDFVPGLLVIPGALFAIGCCVAAIVAGKRGHLTSEATGGEAKAIRIVLGAAILAAVVSGGLTLAGRSSVEAGDSTVVSAKGFEFDRDRYTVEGGTTLVASNSDPFFHTVTIDGLGIDVALSPGKSVKVQVPDLAGTYVLYCKPHTMNAQQPGDDDMAARLVVR